MNIEDIITLEDNTEYLILDIVEYNKDKYLYCVEIDKNENPTDNYKYFKSNEDSNEIYIEEVSDTKILTEIENLFAINYINDYKNEEQDV